MGANRDLSSTYATVISNMKFNSGKRNKNPSGRNQAISKTNVGTSKKKMLLRTTKMKSLLRRNLLQILVHVLVMTWRKSLASSIEPPKNLSPEPSQAASVESFYACPLPVLGTNGGLNIIKNCVEILEVVDTMESEHGADDCMESGAVQNKRVRTPSSSPPLTPNKEIKLPIKGTLSSKVMKTSKAKSSGKITLVRPKTSDSGKVSKKYHKLK